MTEPATPEDPRFTEQHAVYLSQLMEWTGDQEIVSALLREGAATPHQLEDLARAISATVDGTMVFVTEQDARNLVHSWLTNNAVRLVIAKRAAATHDGLTYEQARADLNGLLRDLQGQHRAAKLVAP